MNELLFILHSTILSLAILLALVIGKQALVSLIVVYAIFANLFVLKQITLFGFNATAADAYMVGCVLALNALQEFYGRKSAQKAIWISFGGLVLYGILSQLHCAYSPSLYDTSQEHFRTILYCMPRITLASLSTYFLVSQIDSYLYSMVSKVIPIRLRILRTLTVTPVTQFLDTILFSFLGLYGIVDHIEQIIVVSYGIKLGALLISTPFLALAYHVHHTYNHQ